LLIANQNKIWHHGFPLRTSIDKGIIMHVLYGLFLFTFAGLMNGSFALPSRSLQHWSHEKIWLHYSIWAFLVFPLVIFMVFAPTAINVYQQASLSQLSIIFSGGFLFAIGQICFARGLKSIGLGLGFMINISLGTAFGSLIPLLIAHLDQPFGLPGMLSMVAIALIVFGVFISYVAGLKRDRALQVKASEGDYLLGVGCAVIAGICSAGQNVTFSLTSGLQQIALNDGVPHILAANIIWPGFLLATFIPYAIYMFKNYRSQRHTFVKTANHHVGAFHLLTVLMGGFWYFSLLIYSAGSLKLGSFGPVIGWALFMVCIILTSTWWGWRQGEWTHACHSARRLMKVSLSILILSIMVLAYATFLRH
jgi:L-rhamnose-H+ transport protein